MKNRSIKLGLHNRKRATSVMPPRSREKVYRVSLIDKMSWVDKSSILATFISLALFVITLCLFRQSNKQFAIVNQPYLALLNTDVLTNKWKNTVQFSYSIADLVPNPIHIIRYKSGFSRDAISKEQAFDSLKNIQYENQNAYTTKEHDLTISFKLITNFDSLSFDKLEKGKSTFFAQFDYRNELTDEWRTFIFVIRISSDSKYVNHISEVMYNDNKDTTFRN